jgi:four helix bundle protein
MMNEKQPADLGDRTKKFALRVIRLFASLPRAKEEARVMGRQLLRSGTSVGAHYREARRARSNAEFISKMKGALQELDESVYWMELLVDAGLVRAQKLAPLMDEASELIAIFVTSVRTAKRRE